MEPTKLLMLSILIFIIEVSSGGKLYPFGLSAADTRALHRDDACPQSYNQPIKMFGKQFAKLYVCTNGLISLDKPYVKFKPESFPLQTVNTALICPFWADADMCRGGDLWFREETQDMQLLRKASLEVRDAFRTGADASYNASWLLIATWDKVEPYGSGGVQCANRKPTPGAPVNTFQAVIISDGTTAFAMFNYKSIQWMKGSSRGSTPAQVGFDSGDRKNYYATKASQKPEIINIATETNVGIPGKMIFKLGATAKILLPNKPTQSTAPTTAYYHLTTTQRNSINTTAGSHLNITTITTTHNNSRVIQPLRQVGRKTNAMVLNDDAPPADNTDVIVGATVAGALGLLATIAGAMILRRKMKARVGSQGEAWTNQRN